MQRNSRSSTRGAFGRLLVAAFATASFVAASGPMPAAAAQQVFDVDETQSTFTSGSIDVQFTAIVHSDGLFGSQSTTGGATIANVGYAADGTVTIDRETGRVTLQDLSIGGEVNQSGTGQLVWADLFTFDILYNIMSQALDLNAPLTMALSGGTFSGTPNFEFTGMSDGAVSGLLVNYAIPPQAFGSSGDLPIAGTIADLGPETLLEITGSQLVVDLGASPTIVTEVNECALRLIVCVFFLTTAEITIDSLVYNDVQMNLVATAPGIGPVCGDGNLDAGEGCDDGNTTPGDGCSDTCQVEATCGDGNLDPGEGCDDGNTTSGDGCSATCALEVCGNGVLDPGEACDDGNVAGGDGCSAVCEAEVCGNGVLDVGEACDDGNTEDGDGCSATCELAPIVPVAGPWPLAVLALALLGGGLVATRRFGRAR